MTEGLIWTFEGRVGICLVFAVLGVLLSLAATVLVFIRKAPGWKTQTNHQTGMVEEGLRLWLVRFLAIFVGPWLLALLVVTGIEVTHRAMQNPAVSIAVIAAVALVGVTVWGFGANWKRPTVEAGVEILPATPEPPPVGWSLPTPERQWDR